MDIFVIASLIPFRLRFRSKESIVGFHGDPKFSLWPIEFQAEVGDRDDRHDPRALEILGNRPSKLQFIRRFSCDPHINDVLPMIRTSIRHRRTGRAQCPRGVVGRGILPA